MADPKKVTKKRQLKRTETVRERVERKNDPTAPVKRSGTRKVSGVIAKPFKVLFKVIAAVLRPFAFLLSPFKTKPFRFIGRILSKVLLINFFREAWKELKLVQWPNASETTRLTIAVFIFALVFGAIIATVDYGLEKVFKEVFIN